MEQNTITKKEKIWTRDFTAMVTVLTLITLSYMMMNPNIALYIKSLGGAATLTGSIGLAWTVVSVITRLSIGRVIDRHGSKKLVILGSAGFAVMIALCGMVQTLTAFIIFRIIMACFHAIAYTAGNTLVSEVMAKSRVGEATGYSVGIPQSLGNMWGPAWGLALLAGDNYGLLFFGTAGVMAVSTLITFFCSYRGDAIEKNVQVETEAADDTDQTEYTGIWKSIEKTAIWPSVIQFIQAIGQGSIASYLILYTKGMGMEKPAMFFTVSAFVQLSTRFFGGRLVDRLGIIKSNLLVLLIGVAAMCAIPGCGNNFPLFMAIAILYGLSNGMARPVLNTAVVKYAPKSRMGVATSTFYFAYALGLGVASFVWGIVIDTSGFAAVWYGSAAAFLIAAVLGTIAFKKNHID